MGLIQTANVGVSEEAKAIDGAWVVHQYLSQAYESTVDAHHTMRDALLIWTLGGWS